MTAPTLERAPGADEASTPATRGSHPRSRGSRWLVALRLARREARRSPGSSALVVLLIALPVAAMVAAAAVATSGVPSDEQMLSAALGQTLSRIEVIGGPDPTLHQSPAQPEFWDVVRDDSTEEALSPDLPPLDDPTVLLPPGTTALKIQQASVTAETAAGVGVLSALVGPAGDPAFAGRYDVVSGRAPIGDDELLATASALDRLAVDVGDPVRLRSPARAVTVAGVIEIADRPDTAQVLVLAPGMIESSELVGRTLWYLPDVALTWPQIEDLNAQGVVALSRPVALDPPKVGGWMDEPLVNVWSIYGAVLLIGAMVAAFVAYQVVLLAGAAFAVGARRQQRALATLASIGATARDLQRVVVLQGVVLGAFGALFGTALGLVAGWGVYAVLDTGQRTQFWGYAPNPWITAAIALFAVLVGTIAALLPARAAAKLDVLQALRGARKPQTPRAARPLWGSILLLSGVGVTVVCVAVLVGVGPSDLPGEHPLRWTPVIGIIAGPILAQVGVILAGHWLLAMISRPLSRVGLAARLASRDAAANAARSVPALASIASAVFLAVFAVAMVGANVAVQARYWTPGSPIDTMRVELWSSDGGTPAPAIADRARAAVAATEPDGVAELARRVPEYELVEEGRGETLIPLPRRIDETLCELGDDGEILNREECDDGWSMLDALWVTDADSLPVLLGYTPSAAALRVFAEGGAIVTDPAFDHDGSVKLGYWTAQQLSDGVGPVFFAEDAERAQDPARSDTIPAALQQTDALYPYRVLISAETAAAIDVESRFFSLVAAYDPAPDQADVDAILAQGQGTDAGFYPTVERGPATPWLAIALILAATGVLVLAASGVVLGLARIDGRADDATLAAIGAPPGVRARISFWQALVIGGLGALSGTFAGLLPAIGVIVQSRGQLLLEDVPWFAIAAIAVALPLIVALVNGATARRTPTVTRRTAIA